MMAFTLEVLPGQRCLPMYLLLDVSASMEGQPMRELEMAVDTLHQVLLAIPQAAQTVRISTITFAGEANVIIPPTEVVKFKLPGLQTGGETALGAALKLLTATYGERSAGAPETPASDYKPYVLLLTDARPTDCCETTVRTFRQEWPPDRATIIGLGCGPAVNLAVLQSLTDISLPLADTSQETLAAFFRWAAQAVRIASLSAAQGAHR